MIPRNFHHVWPGDDPFRPELHRFRESFLRRHPDWSFHFWRARVPDVFSPEVRALLEDPRYTVVVKSDVLRFEVLRLYGGVYVDTDVECLRPFDDLLGAAFFCGRESDSALCPSVVGSVPGHPLAALMVRRALERIREAGPAAANRTPNQISGPMLLTDLARDRDDILVLGREAFYPVGWWETERLEADAPRSYAKHWWNGATSEDGWTRRQVFSSPRAGPVRYDLGGVGRREGYLTVNLIPGADRQCDILDLDLLHPRDGEVDEFLLVHTLEHVPVVRYVRFLRDLHRKLRAGGAVVVIQTDADAVLRQYVDGRLSFRSMRSTIFTPEDRVRDNPLHAHQNMWSAEELVRDFRAVGFDAHAFDAGSWALDHWDPLHPDDLVRDHGKAIKNLGVRAIKR